MNPDNLKSNEELIKELQIVQQRLSQLQGMFPVIITALDDQKILYINECAATFFDVQQTQAIGLVAREYWVYPEDRQAFIEKVSKKGQVIDFETCLRTYTGAIRWVLMSTNLITYENQAATYSIVTDITARKETEQALQRSEARHEKLHNLMKLMTDTVPDLIWAKDLNDRFLFTNKAICCKLLMCDDSESPLGKSDAFYANREKEKGFDHTFGEICVNSDEVVKNSRQPGRFLEDGLVRGNYLVLDVYKTPMFDESGQLIGTVGAGRDVTQDVKNQEELRKSEERYRLLANNVRDVIITTDTNLKPTYVTPSIEQLTGYSPEEFLQLRLQDFITAQFRRKYKAVIRLLLADARKNQKPDSRLWEYEWITKDNKIIWVETSTSIIYKPDGTIEGFVSITRETTKKVLAQQELEMAKEAALTASLAKSEFLANMSHEIRTPMNGVLGMLQLLQKTFLDSEQSGYVTTALSSGTNLLKVISDILDFSKIEAGVIALDENHFALRALIQSVCDNIESLINTDKVVLLTEIDENIPSYIISDEARLRQILFNLLGNATKFTEKGQITIGLRNEDLAENSSRLHFTIHDTGIGVSPDKVHCLFEPFVQADGSFRRKYSGTGLGLSIVRQLVELMGGTVDITSKQGDGTTITFDIIIQRSSQNIAEAKTLLPCSSDHCDCLRILVVEDENINALVVTAMLKKLGHAPTLVNNGQHALEILQEKSFDCILMDIQMPEMDGIETANAIRNDLPGDCATIPIIALTAHAMKGDKERFLAAGMNDYLTKPVEIEDLIQILQNYSCTSN